MTSTIAPKAASNGAARGAADNRRVATRAASNKITAKRMRWS